MHSYAARKQPQLDLEELLHLRWLLGGVMALLSIWTLFYLEASLWPLGASASGAIVLVMLSPRLPGRMPRWMWRLGVPVIAGVFLFDLFTTEIIQSLVRLNTLLVLHRAISYRSRREDLQFVMLCLFLIVLTGVVTVSLVFAAQILLFTGVAMAFLFVVNVIQDAVDGESVPDSRWALISRRRFLRRLARVIDIRLMILASGLFVAVLTISTVIFMAIPRVQMESAFNLLSFKREGSVSGFSESISLGEVTEIRPNHAIAMRVDVHGSGQLKEVPYWRISVLDEYSKGHFGLSRSMIGHVGARSYPYLDIIPAWSPEADIAAPLKTAGTTRYTVFLESGVSRFLPLPEVFSAVRFKEMQDLVENRIFHTYAADQLSAVLLSFQIEGPGFGGIIPDPDFFNIGLRTTAARRKSVLDGETAPATSSSDYPGTTLALPVSPAAAAYLQSVVRELTGGEQLDAMVFSARACAWFDRTHNYALGVTLADADTGEDPVIRWMRSGAAGHCEFFAAAFTLLARSAGFPTRAITGFRGGTWNSYENYYMVRQSDAHAWCEIFNGRDAWHRIDPTPGNGGPGSILTDPTAVSVPADDSAAAYMDSLRMLWYRRIVNFDERSQQSVALSVRDVVTTIKGAVSISWNATWEALTTWKAAPWSFRREGDVLYVTVMLFLVSMVMRRLGIGTRELFAWAQRGESPARRHAGELLVRLRERRAKNPRAGRSWSPERAGQLEHDLTVIRYGRIELWPETHRTFRETRRML